MRRFDGLKVLAKVLAIAAVLATFVWGLAPAIVLLAAAELVDP